MVEILRGTELFGDVGDDALAEISGFCELLRLGDGGLLISEGMNESPDLYVVVEGTFDVITRHTAHSDEAMTLGNLDYEVVGEIAWLTGSGRVATVRCRGELEAVRVEGRALMAYLEKHPETGFLVMRRLMKALATKLVDSNFFLM